MEEAVLPAKKVRKKRVVPKEPLNNNETQVASAGTAQLKKKKKKKKRVVPKKTVQDGVPADGSVTASDAAPTEERRRRKKKSSAKKTTSSPSSSSIVDATTSATTEERGEVAAELRKKKKKKRPSSTTKKEETQADIEAIEKKKMQDAIQAEQRRLEEEAAAKPKKAGTVFEERIRMEQEEARKKREEERKAEIEKSRRNYEEHASAVTKVALEKERAELEEKKRLQEIDRHMEAMRGEQGDQVRKRVTEKLRDSARSEALEPVSATEAEKSAGKKWALQQRQELEEKERARQQEREAEITAAREKYMETLLESKLTAAEKEAQWLDEKQRLAEIKEHQEQLSKTRGYGKDESPSSIPDSKPSPSVGQVPETHGRVLTYAEIKGRKRYYTYAEDYDANHLEAYLADSEFQEVFGMTKSDFYAIPAWKRGDVLKKVDLF